MLVIILQLLHIPASQYADLVLVALYVQELKGEVLVFPAIWKGSVP